MAVMKRCISLSLILILVSLPLVAQDSGDVGASTESPGTDEPVNSSEADEPVNSSEADEPVNSSEADEPVNSSEADEPVNSSEADEPVNSSEAGATVDNRPLLNLVISDEEIEVIPTAVDLGLLNESTALRATGNGMLQASAVLLGISAVPWTVYTIGSVVLPIIPALLRFPGVALTVGTTNVASLASGITLSVVGGVLGLIGVILQDVGEDRRIQAISQPLSR